MALLFGADGGEQLHAPGQHGGQTRGLRVRKRPGFRAPRLGEMRDDGGVDGVGLGQPPDRGGEFAGPAGVDDGDRQTGTDQAGGGDGS